LRAAKIAFDRITGKYVLYIHSLPFREKGSAPGRERSPPPSSTRHQNVSQASECSLNEQQHLSIACNRCWIRWPALCIKDTPRLCRYKYDKDTFQRELSRIRSLLLCTKANDACDGLTSIWDRLCSSLADSQPRIIIEILNGTKRK